ncbi:amidase family protein [Bradyrhizobium sp. 170]|uniref:amidase n=1 Tax=Bradyrhizobium sp. 170 TaxID=2782641 RepID=UPI0020001569|nr:amidase family protein [Bradyrhizobium sp. 170]UPK05788.1 amidase [Bradyrhizobium sp. 170]
MGDDLWRLTAVEAITRLKKREITPLDLLEASAKRIAEVEPAVNALPTLCFDRARDHAKRIMADAACRARDEPGWLGGLPVSIKDLMDVAGVRTTYGSPLFAHHVPTRSHPLVERIERKGGIVVAKSNTPEFGAGGSTFNEVFGRTGNPWNTSLTCGGSTGGGAVSVATGEVWLAHGSDHGGSLRGPGTYCSVVGLRPSPGRVTRGATNSLYSPQWVQGPMARTVADLALFLDTMAGMCPHDPMTLDAPAVSFSAAVAHPIAPKRIAFTADLGGKQLDADIRKICTKAVRRFEELGVTVVEASPNFGPVDEVFMARRSQQFVVDSELHIREHREKIKPEILWNTELGLKQTASRLAWAERERAALFRRMVAFFQEYDLLVTPGMPTGAFDINLRTPPTIAGRTLENYLAGSKALSAITVAASPAIAVPCGFDRYGRPVGLQLVGKPRGEAALLQAASLYESLMGLHELLPIDPQPGTVPPSS